MNLTELTIKTALKKMFTSGHFSICDIDKCLKLSNTIPDQEVYQHMSALHCVNYKDMPEELRQWLFDSTVTTFSGNGFDLDLLDFIKEPRQDRAVLVEVINRQKEEAEKKTFLQRLIG